MNQEMMDQQKEEFLHLIKSINREGANIEGLVDKLTKSDFFSAPASTKYHLCTPGGLCLHSLHVYYNLKKLVSMYGLEEDYSPDTLKIVALLHDFSKMNFYETFTKNVKTESGWAQEVGFKVADLNKRFIYGSHEQNAEFMVRYYIPLEIEESAAILHHMGAMSDDSVREAVSDVFNTYPLALLLHMADMAATYIDERI